MRSRIQAAEMRFIKSVTGVRRIDRIRNTAIRESLNVEPLLLKIEKTQLRWFGHVLRMPEERLTKRVFLSQPNGRRPRGRPRKTWRSGVDDICGRIGVISTEVQTVAEDRVQWRSKIASLQTRPERIRGSEND